MKVDAYVGSSAGLNPSVGLVMFFGTFNHGWSKERRTTVDAKVFVAFLLAMSVALPALSQQVEADNTDGQPYLAATTTAADLDQLKAAIIDPCPDPIADCPSPGGEDLPE